MRKLEQLKLNELSKADLKEREMAKLYGGNYCSIYYGDNSKSNHEKDICSCVCMYGLEYYSMTKEEAYFLRKI